MKDICARVEYTVLWGRASKVVGAGMQMCYYPVATQFYVMAVLSGTRVVRVLCVWVATPCCVAACVCVGVAAECARLRLMAPGSASTKETERKKSLTRGHVKDIGSTVGVHSSSSTKRFLFLIIPKRRDCATFASASNNDSNRR